ncbi:MAG: HD domain-containing protein [Bacteroidota bacterium]
MTKKEKVAAIMSLFSARGGEEYFGEDVTQLQHAVQAAEIARELYPDDPEFVAAAFLHDLGHICASPESDEKLMNGFGVKNHEKAGADFLLGLGFPEKVARLVECHVEAKRYLVSTDEYYFEALSAASKITLMHQGGKMEAEEIADFESDPFFVQHIALRRIDERAKSAEHTFSSLQWVEELLEEVVS